jgi:nucleoid DNA-binding protein
MLYKKNEAVRAFADRFGYTYTSATEIYDDVVEFVKETIISGETLSVYGLGTFSVETRPEKEMFNFKEGKKTVFPPRAVPKFTFSDALREKVADANK